MIITLTEGLTHLEETEGCFDSKPLPFRFRYFFTKDPCEKCLVRPSCNRLCEPRYALRDQRQSILAWKLKWNARFDKIFSFSVICFLISSALLCLLIMSGCRKVNHERAEQYYEENVKNFPETNKEKP